MPRSTAMVCQPSMWDNMEQWQPSMEAANEVNSRRYHAGVQQVPTIRGFAFFASFDRGPAIEDYPNSCGNASRSWYFSSYCNAQFQLGFLICDDGNGSLDGWRANPCELWLQLDVTRRRWIRSRLWCVSGRKLGVFGFARNGWSGRRRRCWRGRHLNNGIHATDPQKLVDFVNATGYRCFGSLRLYQPRCVPSFYAPTTGDISWISSVSRRSLNCS